MDIKHVLVLMLENRSFDSMLGMLYPPSDRFDGLAGTEQNTWHKTDGSPLEQVAVWKSPVMNEAAALMLPTAGAGLGIHLRRLQQVPDTKPAHATTAAAGADARTHLRAFLGTL